MRKLLGQLADPNVEEHGTGLTPVRCALIPVAKASSAHDEAPGRWGVCSDYEGGDHQGHGPPKPTFLEVFMVNQW